MPTVAEVLAAKKAKRAEEAGYRKVDEFVGQVLTFLSIEEVPSKFPQKQLKISVLTEEGEEADIYTSSQAVVQTLDELDELNLLPTKLRVISYPSNYGKDGYDLEDVTEQ